ncbi:MAG TPA: SPOR domain-containing protein [Saprospiraceae bacterium]|nr:SPOR domain-containing protein [Saprospiraceae bacterium]HMQ84832.1 SPOR domain-containing protein [Saprospiraceae bacterium]
MSRLDYVTIGIVAICVAALVYLIYMTTNLLGGNKSETPTQQEQTLENSDSEDTEDSYYYDNKTGQDSVSSFEDNTYTDRSDEMDTDDSEYEADEPAEEVPTGKDEYPSSSASRGSSGDYMVLAGTFSVKANAEAMVNKLHDLGYSNASVELFNKGAYAVALVDRFSSLAEANELATDLKAKGIEVFVKEK